MKLTIAAIFFWALTTCALQDAKPATTPVKITATEATQLLLQSAEAVYPEGPEDLKGFVAVDLRIDTEGNVADVTVSVGEPELAAAAVAAFKQYKFKPYMADGRPVECLISATTTFQGRAAGAKLSLQPMKLRVSQGVLDGNKIQDVQPIYPQEAIAARIQGDVVLRATLGTNGEVTNLTVVSGHPLLVQAAMDAVHLWKYKPYLLNGNPAEVDTVITVKFYM